MKTFDIYGDIVDSETCRMSPEDVCPQDIKDFITTIEEDEDVQFNINSAGGSVTAGVSIANMILDLNKTHKTIAKVEGYACSIASVIACACSELQMNDSSFLMIHRVFGNVCGNAEELRKEADLMEMMTESLLTFYHTKFDLTDEELLKYIKAETWISGADADNFKLKVTKTDDKAEFKYAARLRAFNKCPFIDKETINMEEKEINKEDEEVKSVEETETEEAEVKEETPAETSEDKPVEEKTEDVEPNDEEVEEVNEDDKPEETSEDKPTYEELEKQVEELTKQLDECQKKLAECKPDMTVEERVAKCQSTFQNKINHFKDELKAKDEELQKFKDSVSSLTTQLEDSKKELHSMSAAFEEKEIALEKLNSSVLTPSEEKTEWKSLKGEEFFDYLKKNPQLTK